MRGLLYCTSGQTKRWNLRFKIYLLGSLDRNTLWQKFIFSLDVIVILLFWAWNNPLHCPEQFSQALYGNFAYAQGRNLFRSGEGTITEFPGNFWNVRRKYRKFPGRAQKEISWDPSLSPHTVKTPDIDFRTYNRMPQDQTVHGAENVSSLWAE